MADRVSFVSKDGVEWAVFEESDSFDSSSLSGPFPSRAVLLRFESELEVRLLWVYPDDWNRLNTSQLEALCDRANTVIARFPRQARGAPAEEYRRDPDPRDSKR